MNRHCKVSIYSIHKYISPLIISESPQLFYSTVSMKLTPREHDLQIHFEILGKKEASLAWGQWSGGQVAMWLCGQAIQRKAIGSRAPLVFVGFPLLLFLGKYKQHHRFPEITDAPQIPAQHLCFQLKLIAFSTKHHTTFFSFFTLLFFLWLFILL